MPNFVKLNLADEDNPVQTIHQAESMAALLVEEVQKCRRDSNLEGCFGSGSGNLFADGDSLQWEPGDGGQYTIARYAPDTPEGREEIASWLDE